ncbi:MAG: hypothetical protein MUP69_11185 [Candidatus Atribacteria bacterium]|nr:hypothetical protein [Candidatus Atribacteria bacterium]
MKKLLLVLMVVALAAFLLVGCIPSTPAEGEGEGEGVVGICPTVAVTSQVAVGTKTYIKAGSQTITVTFAVPTEPISVYVGADLRLAPSTLDAEVVMYANAAKTVYTGTFIFFGDATADTDCSEAYIYVETCDACAYCKYPYTVDNTGPASQIKISKGTCTCVGCTIEFDSAVDPTVCTTDLCCGDACSGIGSYAIDLYTTKPFTACCLVPCATPAYSCPGGVACPIDCTLSCITTTTTDIAKVYYMVATLLDKVGNRTRYYATLTLDSGCGLKVQEYTANVQSGLCSDYTVKGDYVEQTVSAATSTLLAIPAVIGACVAGI